jgi:hypothetical protein
VIIIFIIIVDPYEFINISHIIESKYKIEVYKRSDESEPRGSMLWNVIHYDREPKVNVIIGDSQGKNFNTTLIKKVSGKDFFNFCLPGSSYETMFQTFWHTAEKCELESVYFQVAFMNYNATRSYNLFHFAQDHFDKPYLYFVTKEILFDSFYNVYYQLNKDPKLVQRSYEYDSYEKLDKLSSYRLNLFFGNYSYPAEYFNELKKIVDYCNKNNIELKFIILPTYKSTLEYLENKNLLSMRDRFKNDIKSLAYVYDFDYPSQITEVRENFIDYFHPRNHVIDNLTKEIWGQ